MDLFRKSAGYRYLDAFVLANMVELGTGHFCDRFLELRNDPGGRTCSQMTHAARSGCRNFAEGSERIMTSYATATTLLDVARASLCELRDDYLKWLMMQGLAPWAMRSPDPHAPHPQGQQALLGLQRIPGVPGDCELHVKGIVDSYRYREKRLL